MMIQAFIFDLDGVVVDTAKYHYLAWKELAGELGFDFPEAEGERLKGVSRMDSLEIVLESGRITGLTAEEKKRLADRKNKSYLTYINRLDEREILPGILKFLKKIRAEGYKTALGSASKSGGMILQKLGIADLFDVIVDGLSIVKAKPDPEVFLTAAAKLGADPGNCIVIEDAQAGVLAAQNGGMHCIGIGSEEIHKGADVVLEHTGLLPNVNYRALF